MDDSDTAALLAFAQSLADDARAIALRHFRRLSAIDSKDDSTPVTAADREIERRLRERIDAAFPAHGVFGEEEGVDRGDAEFVWVLDPIDGTKAFSIGSPLFGTLIGLLHRGEPVVGVLEAPALGERWAAAKGRGAVHQGRAIRVRAPRSLAAAVLCCTTPEPMVAEPGFERLRRSVRWTSWGGDCCAYGFVASGGADLVVDRGLKPYDWCALVPIVQEAGGVFTDRGGRPMALGGDGTAVAASCAELAGAAREALGWT